MVWYRYWAVDEDVFRVERDTAGARPAPQVADEQDPETQPRDEGDEAFHVKPSEPARGEGETTPPSDGFHVEQPASAARPAGPMGEEALGGDTGAGTAQRPASGRTGPQGPDLAGGPRVVVVANQKGGVGKTTTAVSVAAALAQQDLAILLVDLDPQGNATSGLSIRPDAGEFTTYDVLVNDVPAAKAVCHTDIGRLDVMPASIDLAGAEIELVSAFSREQKLQRALQGVREDYDLILVDCPPSLGLLTVNALAAGDGVLVPIQCEYYALEGLRSLERNIELIRLHLNPGLATLGYVMTMYDGRTRLSEQVVDEVRRYFGDAVFTTRIPRSVRLAEAPSYGQPIAVFDPSSRGAVAYHRVASELIDRLRTSTEREGVVHP